MTVNGKHIIGLTGNIATGKSVVRKMLEHLGAYGIDADFLSHRAMGKGSPGYQLIIDEFGKHILNLNKDIDREKMGNIVFSDPEALASLEEIIHPLVRKAVDHLIKNAPQKVVVVEAIKLLESPLKEKLDSVWVTAASEADQIERIIKNRDLSEADARERMASQSSQEEKIAAADVVIQNVSTFDDTWEQVQTQWKKLFSEDATTTVEEIKILSPVEEPAPNEFEGAALNVGRATPKQAEAIANFINRISEGAKTLTRIDIMAAFGEKAFMILTADDQMVGVIGWRVDNLVAQTDEVWMETNIDISKAIPLLIQEIETAANELQAEAALVFIPQVLADQTDMWGELGYEQRSPEKLNVSAWQEAAKESISNDTILMFKQLRIDRVLRPI